MQSSQLSNDPSKQTDARICQVEKQIYKKLQNAHNIIDDIQSKEQPFCLDNYITSTESQQNHRNKLDEVMNENINPPPFQKGCNYFDIVWRTFTRNEILLKKIKSTSDINSNVKQYINEVQSLSEQYRRLHKLKNRKKNRRLAIQIKKQFTCPYESCLKIYGSDVSLNLHIKLKHNGGNKTDRQNLAEQICQAQQKGQQPPIMRLNLPPGYLNEYKKLYFQREFEQNEMSQIKHERNPILKEYQQ